MKETYTFSRALHMMRYGGKKMASLKSGITYKCEVGFLFLFRYDEYVLAGSLKHDEIMGSWVEVDDV